jgi:hypothetical protein
MKQNTDAATDETRYMTTDDVDVEVEDEITVALIHEREEVEFTGKVLTVYNGGWFKVETDDGKILSIDGKNLKVQEDMRDDKTDYGMFSYITVNTDDDVETDISPVAVDLHDDKPDENAQADGMWVLTDCDECGAEGYTGESACYDAYDSQHAPGLVCKNCA